MSDFHKLRSVTRSCVYLPLAPMLRFITYIFITFTLCSCFSLPENDWRQEYIGLEKSRVTSITKFFDFNSGNYVLKSVDSTFDTFDEKGQKVGTNNKHFYKYDSSGKIMEEEYCMRTCESPGRIKYYYDSLNRLVKTTVITTETNPERVEELYFYGDNNLLIKKAIGDDPLSTTETFNYDSLARLQRKSRREYNTNVNQWLEYIDSLFYDSHNNVIVKKRWQVGEDLLTISKYTYNNRRLLTIQSDTTITTIKSYLLTPEMAYSPYYRRTEFKYNSEEKLVEKIVFRTDYKTPSFKISYEYKK